MTTERLYATLYVAFCRIRNHVPNRKHAIWFCNRRANEIRADYQSRGRTFFDFPLFEFEVARFWKETKLVS